MLSLKKIKKSYTTGDFTQEALKGVDLFFDKNEFISILGASGSGKTTLLNIIGGLDRYDSGDLLINNKSTKSFKDKDWDAYRNNSIGFVFQSYNLISHISIQANVEMCLTLSGISKSERRKKAIIALNRVGLKDHLRKLPNQLSGGQMQRVAIARALVNDPDIILADEPTGALDSNTSKQILDLIKEISKDKLVIMVTHNRELASVYSNRIIELKDGLIISDSSDVKKDNSKKDYSIKKTSMSFFTALNLSLNNIFTKKGRTLLTAFASSIGIIGIAIILSLSNGFDKQIDKFEKNTLSSFPIYITPQAMNMSKEDMKEFDENMHDLRDGKVSNAKKIFPYDSTKNSMVHNNNITNDYVKYIEKMNNKEINGISYIRTTNFNIINKNNGEASLLNIKENNFLSLPFSLNKDKFSYLKNSYDILEGVYPKNYNELVISVDNENRIESSILKSLGIDINNKSIDYKEVLNKEFKLVLNNDYYTRISKYFRPNTDLNKLYNNKNNITLKIVGVVRVKDGNTAATVSSAMSSDDGMNSVGNIFYNNDLVNKVIELNNKSNIVNEQMKNNYNVLTGEIFDNELGEENKNNTLSYLGADSVPSVIGVFPKDFNTKDNVTKYLDKYNKGKKKEDKIIYQDMAKQISSMSSSIMDAITIVLIAFSSISLVVSSIMIGIITYISVLERTKEIGILRSMGARKKDITRVFNAETFLIGFTSGIIAIFIAWILLFPINNILYDLSNLKNVASMNPLHMLALLIISIILTVIGGFIPAKMASRKDPVEALRTE